MRELLRNAWLGWQEYTSQGKLACLLLAALLFLWAGRRRREQEPFLLYATLLTVCCICPVTAALLMVYQTRFYDYEWIWSLAPLTAAAAWGMSRFLAGQWEEKKFSALPAAGLLAAAVFLCGSLGGNGLSGDGADRQEAAGARNRLEELYPEAELCLWAPREVMEYGRETDASLRLPYGRNMWDDHLNAYAYDTYDDGLKAMAGWMDWAEETGEADWKRQASSGNPRKAETVRLEDCARKALESGVNCVLLPENVLPETLRRMEEALGTEARKLENYYLFRVEERAAFRTESRQGASALYCRPPGFTVMPPGKYLAGGLQSGCTANSIGVQYNYRAGRERRLPEE